MSEPSNGPSAKVRIHSAAQLLVEGTSDRNFIRALANKRSLGAVQIQVFGGVGNLRRFLAGFVRSRRFNEVASLGVLRDADEDPAAAFRSVQHAIRDYVGEPPAQAGVIVAGQAARSMAQVGILIVPEHGPGMLETVLCRTFAEQPITRCIEDFMVCAADAENRDLESPKAWAHAYLSTRRRPGADVGVAARQGFWDLDHAALDPIANFVRAIAATSENRSGPATPG